MALELALELEVATLYHSSVFAILLSPQPSELYAFELPWPRWCHVCSRTGPRTEYHESKGEVAALSTLPGSSESPEQPLREPHRRVVHLCKQLNGAGLKPGGIEGRSGDTLGLNGRSSGAGGAARAAGMRGAGERGRAALYAAGGVPRRRLGPPGAAASPHAQHHDAPARRRQEVRVRCGRGPLHVPARASGAAGAGGAAPLARRTPSIAPPPIHKPTLHPPCPATAATFTPTCTWARRRASFR